MQGRICDSTNGRYVIRDSTRPCILVLGHGTKQYMTCAGLVYSTERNGMRWDWIIRNVHRMCKIRNHSGVINGTEYEESTERKMRRSVINRTTQMVKHWIWQYRVRTRYGFSTDFVPCTDFRTEYVPGMVFVPISYVPELEDSIHHAISPFIYSIAVLNTVLYIQCMYID